MMTYTSALGRSSVKISTLRMGWPAVIAIKFNSVFDEVPRQVSGSNSSAEKEVA